MEHHKPYQRSLELDPDYTDGAPNWWQAIVKTWWNRQPGVEGSVMRYKRMMADMDTPASRRAVKRDDGAAAGDVRDLLRAWHGPAMRSKWRCFGGCRGRSACHGSASGSAGRRTTRSKKAGTRIRGSFKARLGYWASMAMEYHLIHHLYPGILNHRQREAYHALKDVLQPSGRGRFRALSCSRRISAFLHRRDLI